MFKRLGAILIVILVLIGNIVIVDAAETTNVKDFLNYLTEGEANELQTGINGIKTNFSLDTVIVITDNTNGKSSRNFADDYFDYNGYGIGSDASGLLMLINMQKREVWISTTGRAIGIYTDSRISTMVDNVTGYLSSGKYYLACNRFLSDVESYSSSGVPGGNYNYDGYDTNKRRVYQSNKTYFEKVVTLARSFPVYIIALVAAFIPTLIISLSSKGKVTINSLTYEENGTFQLSGTADDYIRQTVTKTKIQTNSSSTHRGSSGRSHGGGGGRF